MFPHDLGGHCRLLTLQRIALSFCHEHRAVSRHLRRLGLDLRRSAALVCNVVLGLSLLGALKVEQRDSSGSCLLCNNLVVRSSAREARGKICCRYFPFLFGRVFFF